MSYSSRDRQILEHILEYCRKIQRTIERFGNSYASFEGDPDYIDSVSMNLLQIGELAGKFSDEYAAHSKELGISWRAIKNMRNMFAHDYGAMDLERIWETADQDIAELVKFCVEELASAFT